MAGKKGFSGRRPLIDEVRRFKVLDSAWRVCEKILKDEDAPLNIKADIAKSLATKNIPTEIRGSLGSHTINVINYKPQPSGYPIPVGGIATPQANAEATSPGANGEIPTAPMGVECPGRPETIPANLLASESQEDNSGD